MHDSLCDEINLDLMWFQVRKTGRGGGSCLPSPEKKQLVRFPLQWHLQPLHLLERTTSFSGWTGVRGYTEQLISGGIKHWTEAVLIVTPKILAIRIWFTSRFHFISRSYGSVSLREFLSSLLPRISAQILKSHNNRTFVVLFILAQGLEDRFC